MDFGGFLFHVLCIWHIFNLIVQDILKHISVQIGRIKKALVYIPISPNRKQILEKSCAEHSIKYKNL